MRSSSRRFDWSRGQSYPIFSFVVDRNRPSKDPPLKLLFHLWFIGPADGLYPRWVHGSSGLLRQVHLRNGNPITRDQVHFPQIWFVSFENFLVQAWHENQRDRHNHALLSTQPTLKELVPSLCYSASSHPPTRNARHSLVTGFKIPHVARTCWTLNAMSLTDNVSTSRAHGATFAVVELVHCWLDYSRIASPPLLVPGRDHHCTQAKALFPNSLQEVHCISRTHASSTPRRPNSAPSLKPISAIFFCQQCGQHKTGASFSIWQN